MPIPSTIRIATRKSKLALWQAHHVAHLLQAKFNIPTELVPVVTKGDRILDIPLAEIGGKGLFLKEIEDALIRGDADIAVHSMKDVPSQMPDELVLAAMLERENPSDALIGADSLEALPKGAIVGTASLRRHAQLLAARPDLDIKTLRGNVDSRIAKQLAGEYHAIVLATAGLKRIGLTEHIGWQFSPDVMLPAVAQGCVGVQCSKANQELTDLLKTLEHNSTFLAVSAERQCNEALGGSCHAPIAVHGHWNQQTLILDGMVGNLQGQILRDQVSGTISSQAEAQELGSQLAELLFAQGALNILQSTVKPS